MTFTEVTSDIITFEHYNPSTPVWKVLPTNYSVNSKGLAVMGAGLAKQFVDTYGIGVAYELGVLIQCNPSIARLLPLGLHGNAFWWALPTKYSHSDDQSSTELIKAGLWELKLYHTRQVTYPAIVTPRLGCGCGTILWRRVKTIITSELKGVKEVIVCHKS